MKKATSKDWKTHPLPKKRSLIPADRQFTSAEMDRIKRGVIPLEMEDKWFIFFKRNRLYFHRSWTGFCVYIAHFKRKQDGQVLCLIEANRNAKQYREKDDAYDAKLFFYILDLLLLGRQTPFPQKAGESPDDVPIHQWSQVGKAMLSESKSDDPEPAAPAASGFVAALNQASKEKYLGDPEVIKELLLDFCHDAIMRRVSKWPAEDSHFRDQGHALALASIFLGLVPAFAPVIPWNSPGQIDRWLATELQPLNITGETPEILIANVMMFYLNECYKVFNPVAGGHSQEELEPQLTRIINRFANLVLGIPAPQEECEED